MILSKRIVMIIITCIPFISGAAILKNIKVICYEDISLTSQTEVDAFAATYRCSEISGNMDISGGDITNLDSLYSLKKINGNLTIYSNSKLININGLRGLTSVGGMIEISDNSILTNLDGLAELASIGYWNASYQGLIINNNPALISVKGLKALKFIPGIVDIENNRALPDLNGFESLTQIGVYKTKFATLIIRNNASLTNINGLSALKEVTGSYITSLSIIGNPSLLNLDGLSSLTEILGTYAAGVTILDNSSLTTVSGLSSLISIEAAYANLNINDNSKLNMGGSALYSLLHKSELDCPTTADCLVTTIVGNGIGFTKANILAGEFSISDLSKKQAASIK